MKFTCSQLTLVRAIGTISRAVSTRTTIPVLKGILLEVKNGNLIMTASDLDISIQTVEEIQGGEDGSAVVNARLFGDIIRKLPNSLVSVETVSASQMSIKCLGSNFDIVALSADEFPLVSGIDEKIKLNIKKNDFADLIAKTAFAASIDEKKGILVGNLIKFSKDSIEMVALDGFRMAIAKKPAEGVEKEFSIIVPAKILVEIAKILNETDCGEYALLKVDEKKIEVVCGNNKVIARQLNGEYIKYEDIIPKTYKTRCFVSRPDLMSSIERASLLAREGKNNLIKLNVEKDKIEISSRSEEGNLKEDIESETEGDGLVIGFNAKYVIDALKAVGDEEIVLEMTSNISSCLIKPSEGDEYTYLVLPVRISA